MTTTVEVPRVRTPETLRAAAELLEQIQGLEQQIDALLEGNVALPTETNVNKKNVMTVVTKTGQKREYTSASRSGIRKGQKERWKAYHAWAATLPEGTKPTWKGYKLSPAYAGQASAKAEAPVTTPVAPVTAPVTPVNSVVREGEVKKGLAAI